MFVFNPSFEEIGSRPLRVWKGCNNGSEIVSTPALRIVIRYIDGGQRARLSFLRGI